MLSVILPAICDEIRDDTFLRGHGRTQIEQIILYSDDAFLHEHSGAADRNQLQH